MKVLIVAPTPFFVSRGTPIRILEEALALERRGHKITLVSYHIGEDIPKSVHTSIDHRRIRRWLFWYKKLEAGADWQKILLDVMLFRKVLSLAMTQKPDVLYGHLHEGALIGWAVKQLLFWRRIILVSDLHGGLASEMASHGYLQYRSVRKFFECIERWVNGLGDVVVTSSGEYTAGIQKELLSRGKEVRTLLDGADMTRYVRVGERKNLRERWGIPINRYVFVYTGALIENKGLTPMLTAMKNFLQDEGEREVFFVLAGFPVEHAERLVCEYSLEQYVRIISPLSYFDLPELLSVCDAGIDPKDSSVYQASGKILQYMASELPVICLDRENNRRYLEDGGIYCEGGVEGLVKGFVQAMQYPQVAREKGRKNRIRVRDFSWEKGAKQIEASIEEYLSKRMKKSTLRGEK